MRQGCDAGINATLAPRQRTVPLADDPHRRLPGTRPPDPPPATLSRRTARRDPRGRAAPRSRRRPRAGEPMVRPVLDIAVLAPDADGHIPAVARLALDRDPDDLLLPHIKRAVRADLGLDRPALEL